jgi:hypothetical protein
MGQFPWQESFSRRFLSSSQHALFCIKQYVGLGFEDKSLKIRYKSL